MISMLVKWLRVRRNKIFCGFPGCGKNYLVEYYIDDFERKHNCKIIVKFGYGYVVFPYWTRF